MACKTSRSDFPGRTWELQKFMWPWASGARITRVDKSSQILAVQNLMNFLCGWCCGKIHNNVWGNHLGDWFPARNFLYSSSEKSLFDWKVHHFWLIWARTRLYLVPVMCIFFQNQSWRLSLWKTYNNVGGATRGDYSAQRIFADSTFGRSLLLSKSAPLDPLFAEFSLPKLLG